MKLFRDFGIRALFGVIILCGFVFSTIYCLLYSPDKLSAVKDIFMPLVMAIIGFYFGARSNRKKEE